MNYIIEELKYHSELRPDYKEHLLNNIEYVKTFQIREKGVGTLPDEWINPNTIEIDKRKLYELWMRPSEGYLYKMLAKSKKKEDLERLKK